MTLIDHVKQSAALRWLRDRGGTALLAVSGGSDSTAMTLLLHALVEAGELNVDLAIGHVQHDLRDEGPAGDRAFVESLAREIGLPFFRDRAEVRETIQEQSVSPEAYARTVRYEKLGRIALEQNCEAVLVAHHLDDQIETILLRLIRGTGLDGLTGIPAKRRLVEATGENGGGGDRVPMLLRPLLGVTKNDLKQFLRNRDREWRTDPTNERDAYRRNRIRKYIVPAVKKELGSSFPDLLLRIRRRARSVTDRLRNRWEASIPAHGFDRPSLYIRRSELESLSPMLHPYLLRWIREQMGLPDERPSFHDLRRLKQLLSDGETGREETLSDRLIVRLEHDYMVVRRRSETRDGDPTGEDRITIREPCEKRWKHWGIQVLPVSSKELRRERNNFRADPWRELIDTQYVTGTITVSSRSPGDRIRPLGMDGQKKIKDVMIDQRVPASLRDRWPVFRDDERVLWLPGLCLSDHVRVRSSTEPDHAWWLDCTDRREDVLAESVPGIEPVERRGSE